MIDFHCHLDLYPEPLQVAKECHRRGAYVLSVTTTPSAWAGTSALAPIDSRIRTALGLHPQIAHERHGELPLFDKLISNAAYVGEIGLDGGPEFKAHWAIQMHVFEHILDSCTRTGGRILSIHSRHACKDVLRVLERFPRAGTPILHWFSGSRKDAERAVELGCWFSVGPGMLRGVRGRGLIKAVPRDRILTESDGPFAQMNGLPVLPWQVEIAVSQLADLWEVSHSDVVAVLHQNLRRLVSERQNPPPPRAL